MNDSKISVLGDILSEIISKEIIDEYRYASNKKQQELEEIVRKKILTHINECNDIESKLDELNVDIPNGNILSKKNKFKDNTITIPNFMKNISKGWHILSLSLFDIGKPETIIELALNLLCITYIRVGLTPEDYTDMVQNNPERIGYYWKLPNEFEELIESSHAHEIEQEFLKKYGCLVDKLERGCINVEYKRNNDSLNKVTELYKNKKKTKNDNTENNVVKFSISDNLDKSRNRYSSSSSENFLKFLELLSDNKKNKLILPNELEFSQEPYYIDPNGINAKIKHKLMTNNYNIIETSPLMVLSSIIYGVKNDEIGLFDRNKLYEMNCISGNYVEKQEPTDFKERLQKMFFGVYNENNVICFNDNVEGVLLKGVPRCVLGNVYNNGNKDL